MSASSACCCVAANRQYSKHQVAMAVAWAADKTGETGRDSLSAQWRPQCHVYSHQPFPGTAMGFPLLAQSRQLVGGKTPEHVAALITAPHRPQPRKTTKWGYIAVYF